MRTPRSPVLALPQVKNGFLTSRLIPPILALSALSFIEAALLLSTLSVALPACGMRLFTGWPCPLCGATRCLASLGRFEFASAFMLNPLLVLLVGGVLVWFLFWLTFPGFRHPRLASPPLKLLVSSRLWLVLICLNWLFLSVFLP